MTKCALPDLKSGAALDINAFCSRYEHARSIALTEDPDFGVYIIVKSSS